MLIEDRNMFDIDDVERYIAGYSKIPNIYGNYEQLFVYEFSKPVPLAFLQKLFNVDPEPPDLGERYLIDCYIIDEKKAKSLQPFVKEKLELDKYDFALQCCRK